MSDEAHTISSDHAILQAVSAGMIPQAANLIQLRQMKALERIADALERLEGELPLKVTIPSQQFTLAEIVAASPEAVILHDSHVGPATDVEDPGTPRARRRRTQSDRG